MSFIAGFIFTEAPLQDLESRGFHFHQDQRTLAQGYRSFTAVFPDSSAFQIRQITDEDLYRQIHHNEHFAPFAVADSHDLSPFVQANSVTGVQEVIHSAKIESSQLKTYLEIRKPFSIWALHLKCENFELFCRRAKPDRIFDWKGEKVALIHLGPNCFDLLIT